MGSKKTFYHEFMDGTSSRSVVEINNTTNTMQKSIITKTITEDEIENGEVVLSDEDVMDCFFRFWSTKACNTIESGKKYTVKIVSGLKTYRDKNTYMKKTDQGYVLGCMEVINDTYVSEGETIELFWERDFGAIVFMKSTD